MATKHYMSHLEKMQPAEVMRELDLKAQEMKNAVISTPNYIPRGERVIYVSNAGDDANDGLSMERPIATLEKVCEIQSPGDTILFKRGDHFRGRITAKHDGVTYSAYGEGVKPIIDSSRRNFADPSIWELTDCENIYVCKEEFNNAGLIHFDPSYTYGQYNELYGKMRLRGGNGGAFMEYSDLDGDLQFFCDRRTNKLYLYSAEGNPGERFLDIEIGEVGNTIGGSAHNVTVDNLWIMHTGSHGVGSGTTVNRTVTNCIFSWLGGSMLGGEIRNDKLNLTRYGNAVEIYGGCRGYRVENNWMYQIYDTAVTHQFGGYSEGNCHQHDVVYRDNLMEFCFWFIEFYDGEREGTERSVKNVYMSGNFCRFGGYGWGCKGREGGSPMFCGSRMCEDVENFVAENNIFSHTKGYLVRLTEDPGSRKIVLRNNVYVNQLGLKFAHISGISYPYDENVRQLLIDLVHEEEPTVIYMKNPGYTF